MGKTTTSASIAVRMAKVRRSVLIISTDPAHNLSDAFDQKFSNEPIQVRGFENLFCMEIDPKAESASPDFLKEFGAETESGDKQSFWKEIIGAVPGIDEATSFSEVLRQVQDKNYDLIIFDTAPTGHTLRLLNFPSILDKALTKIMQIKEKISPMLSGFAGLMGGMGGGPGQEDTLSQMSGKFESFKTVVDNVNA